MELEQRVRDAATVEELNEMHAPLDEYDDLTEYADDNEDWYNEAVWTATRLFVEAAEESDEFRERFLSQETKEVEVGDTTIEMEVWRSTLEKECPETYEKVMGIGLSAFQGGSAENTARKILEAE